jgi:threonine dehydratase
LIEQLPTIKDIETAIARLAGYAIRTPVLESKNINAELNCRLLIKAECLQRTGSFKFRGAFNMISTLTNKQKEKGVVAFSSGNHAQGVAAAAKIFGIKATIVMPNDAPQIKITNTKNDGAKIILYKRSDANREEIAFDIVKKTGATLIPPFDALEIMAGQGTLGIEFIEQAKKMGVHLDCLLGPCSGGGMIGGTAIAFEDKSPQTSVYSVEPEGYDDTALSLKADKRVKITPGSNSFCDSLLIKMPGKLTFESNRKLLTGGVVVNQAETANAIKLAFREYKIIVEPGGAVALAAVISKKINPQGKTIGVICSGGNIDEVTFIKILEGYYDS